MPEDGWVYRWCARALSAKGCAGTAYWTAKVHAAAVSGCTGTGACWSAAPGPVCGQRCTWWPFEDAPGQHCTATTAVLEGVGR